MDTIKTLRDEIDVIDEKILHLLNERADLALQIGEIKKEDNLEYYNPKREQEIIERLQRLNKGLFPNDTLRSIFKEIFCASLFLEQPKNACYLGPQATFTHLAAIRYFGSTCKFLPAGSIREVFETVEGDRADYGVVPIENSNEGVVSYTLDMFADYTLNVHAEIMLEIDHHLLAKTKDMGSITKIYSHPHATAQCRSWLERNMLGVPIFDSPSTAHAASYAAQEPGVAAIGTALAAKIYDLHFVQKNIEDNKDNLTRFLVISKTSQSRTGNDKTLIMFTVRDEPGALHDILSHFRKGKINLTKIESRPSKKKAWDYVFFVDLQGHIEDKKVKKALEGIRKRCTFLKILGSYPQMDTIEK